MAVRNAILGGTDWAEEGLTPTDLNATINAVISRGANTNPIISPIGSVVAWLKSFTNTPALPAGWVECNGQTLSDAQSPYNGQVIPNLNGASAGTKRFLKGSETSGTTGGAATHNHATPYGYEATGANYEPGETPVYGTKGTANMNWKLITAGGASTASHPLVATSTENNEPPYYEVVWIMRIK